MLFSLFSYGLFMKCRQIHVYFGQFLFLMHLLQSFTHSHPKYCLFPTNATICDFKYLVGTNDTAFKSFSYVQSLHQFFQHSKPY